MQEMQIPSLGQEDPLEEGMASCSSILAWRIPWTEKPGRLQSIGLQRVGHDRSDWVHAHMYRERMAKEEATLFFLILLCHSSVSKSLRPRGLQHARPPCPSPSPGVYSNSCPLSRWCHPTLSSSVTTFSSCLQSFPASGSFPVSWLFTSGGQSIGASISASVIPMNISGWFPLLKHFLK